MTKFLHLQPPKSIDGATIPYELALDELVKNAAGGSPAGIASIIAIAGHSTPESLQLLVEYTRNDDHRIRRAALVALRYHPLSARAFARIAEMSADPVSHVRLASAETTTFLKVRVVRRQMEELIKSEMSDVRARAVQMYEKVWDDGDFEVVWNLMINDADPSVREAAARVVNLHVDATNWRPCFDHWVQSPDADWRARACELAQTYSTETAALVAPLFSDRNGRVRGAAKRAAGISD